MEIKLRGLDALGLTETCSDIEGFMRAVREKGSPALAEHIARCPSCRKVAADAIRALASDGIPGEPPSADGTAGSPAGTAPEGPVEVVARSLPGGEIRAAGAPFEVIGRGPALRLSPPAPFPARLEIECLEGRYLLRLLPVQRIRGAIVVLRDDRDEPCAPPRRLESTISWSALPPGCYRLAIASPEAKSEMILRLVVDGGTHSPAD